MPFFKAVFITACFLCVHLSLGVKIATLSSQPSTAFESLHGSVCGSNECTDVSQMSIKQFQSNLASGHYDGVLVEGPTSPDIADHAAWTGTPVVRILSGNDHFHPAFERPALIVGDALSTGRVDALQAVGLATVELTDATFDAVVKAVNSTLQTRLNPAFTCTRVTDLLTATTFDATRHPFHSTPLGLAMIVKNEAITIQRTLESARPHIDGWTVVDTGSTDDTLAAIKNSTLAASLPGTASTGPFQDFAQARNLALLTHGDRTAYTLMPDADFGFVGLWRLRSMVGRLEAACARTCTPVCADALRLVRRHPGMDVNMVVVFPSHHALGTPDGWHYTHPVHEVASLGRDNGGHAIDVPPYVRLEPLDGVNPTVKSPARWRNFDLPTLQREAVNKPNDTRTAFYLARTYHALDDNHNAFHEYDRRINLGGWYEEIFMSHLEKGRILTTEPGVAASPGLVYKDPTNVFLEAATVDPERAEPYYELAAWHDKRAGECDQEVPEFRAACQAMHHAAGYVYGKAAAERAAGTATKVKLFKNTHVYNEGAHLQLALHSYLLGLATEDAWRLGYETASALKTRFPGRQPFERNAELHGELVDRLKEGLCV